MTLSVHVPISTWGTQDQEQGDQRNANEGGFEAAFTDIQTGAAMVQDIAGETRSPERYRETANESKLQGYEGMQSTV